MELSVKMKLNDRTEIGAVFSGDDMQIIIKEAGCLLDFDGNCGLCSSTDITLGTRVTKEGFKYTDYICKKCGAKRPWGKYNDGKGYFLKPWQEKFEKSE